MSFKWKVILSAIAAPTIMAFALFMSQDHWTRAETIFATACVFGILIMLWEVLDDMMGEPLAPSSNR